MRNLISFFKAPFKILETSCKICEDIRSVAYAEGALRTLKVQIVEKLKKRHFLSVSQAREQILHIARETGLSVKELRAIRGPKESKAEMRGAKFLHSGTSTKLWAGCGHQLGWVRE